MSTTRRIILGAAIAAAVVSAAAVFGEPPPMTDAQAIARGKYIARIAGCNDCHTPGYAVKGGQVPEQEWLTGDAMGWRGGWGTTYAANLRTLLAGMSEEQWVKTAKNMQTRPPMPWFALHDMSEEDLRAFHRFVRSLGPAGGPAPAYVPPGQQPKGPYIQFPGAPS